jgi:hypothetical protein
MQLAGIEPTNDLQEQAQLNTVARMSQGGDHAANLLTPEQPEQPEMPPPEPKPMNKTTYTKQVKKAGKNGNGTSESLVHQFESPDESSTNGL